jgi:hypothetical protein
LPIPNFSLNPSAPALFGNDDELPLCNWEFTSGDTFYAFKKPCRECREVWCSEMGSGGSDGENCTLLIGVVKSAK